MIDMLYLASAEQVQIQAQTAIQQSGIIHSKVAGRFEIVKELPKKADTFDNMFDYADAFGKIRLAYISSAHKISLTANKVEKKSTVIGGFFGLDTAQYYGINLHIAAYISQNVHFVNPDTQDLNQDFFTPNNESFVYIGEASIDYSNDVFQTKLGRLRVETPYANSDDIRIAPNTFEGVWANVDYSQNLTTQMLYFKRWAGYDSQDEDAQASQSNFKDLVSSDSFGMFGASLVYEYAPNSEVSFWYNYIDDMAAIAYAEVVGAYFINGDNITINYGLQVSNIAELNESNVEGNVFGAMAIFHYDGLFFGGAYNISLSATGKSVTNGFGGGPYYTSLDEATIAAVSQAFGEYQNTNKNEKFSNNNAEAFRIGTGYEFENISVEGLVVEFVYGTLSNDNGKIKEIDAILTYEMRDNLYLEAIYTNYESSCDNNTFDRTLVRFDYSF